MTLYEMRPVRNTPAHQTSDFGELVCSNSLKSNALDKASGLLKTEMRRFDSLIIGCAGQSAVAAGSALAVDRVKFAALITCRLTEHPLVTLVRDEVEAIRAAGLGAGGSLENVIIVSDTGTSSPLRFPEELARHKALDLLGDLALLGARLAADVIAIKGSHALHGAAVDEIRRTADAER